MRKAGGRKTKHPEARNPGGKGQRTVGKPQGSRYRPKHKVMAAREVESMTLVHSIVRLMIKIKKNIVLC